MDPTLSLGRELTCTVRPRALLFSSSPAHRYLLTQTVADWGEMLPPGRPGIAHALNLLQRQLGSIKARIEITQGRQVLERAEQVYKPKSFECPHCGRVFGKSTALGGHISKMHPGRGRLADSSIVFYLAD